MDLDSAVNRMTDTEAMKDLMLHPVRSVAYLLAQAEEHPVLSPAYMEFSRQALARAEENIKDLDPASPEYAALARAITQMSRYLTVDWGFQGQDIAESMSSMTASGDCGCDSSFAVAEVEDVDTDAIDVPKTARWEGPIGFETVMTGDGRYIEDQALRWTTPIPLRYVQEDTGAHDNAQVVGTIDTIERRDGGVIWGSGVFDLGSEVGREAYRQVKGGYTTGVSMDLDNVSFEVRMAAEVVEEMMAAMEGDPGDMELAEDGSVIVANVRPDSEVSYTKDANIRAATIVAIPAFQEAQIAVIASARMYAYNPNQARAPKGRDDGGQWIDTPTGLLGALTQGGGGSATPFERPDIVADTAENGGGSYDPVTLESPTTGYMVATRGNNLEVPAEQFFEPEMSDDILIQWALDHEEALSQPGAHIGTWYDEANDEVVLDVSENVATLDEAVALGIERNQQAIWDVENGVEVDTGGTGDRNGGTEGEDVLAASRGLSQLAQGAPAGVGSGFAGSREEAFEREVAYGYNPSQARAPKGTPIGGRWIETPGGVLNAVRSMTSAPALAQDHSNLATDAADSNGEPYGEEAVLAANATHDFAMEHEPQITADFQHAVANNGVADQMTGLEYRVKAPKSLATKIRAKAARPGVTAAMAANDVHDAIRYTVQSDEGIYLTSMQSTLDTLMGQGYSVVEKKDFWVDDGLKDLAYKGINVKVVSPDGVKIELQFHTPASLKVKDGLHVLYDQQKLTTPGSKEFASIEEQMVRLVAESGLRTPDGYDTV